MKLLRIFLFVLLGVVVFATGFMWYAGFFIPINISEKDVGPHRFVVIKHKGDYSKTPELQDSLYRLLLSDGIETFKGVVIYYDDPSETIKPKTEWLSLIGCVLEEKDYNIISKFGNKYMVMKMSKTYSMVVEFPYKNNISIIAGTLKVYPEIEKYTESNNYKQLPTIEIFDIANGKIIYSMAIEAE